MVRSPAVGSPSAVLSLFLHNQVVHVVGGTKTSSLRPRSARLRGDSHGRLNIGEAQYRARRKRATSLHRSEPKTELLSRSTNAIVEAQEFHARRGRTGRQGGGQVNRIKRADWLRGKRLSRSIDDV